jgi:putative flippase GtrA
MKKIRAVVFSLYKHHFVRYLLVGGSTFILDFSMLVSLHTKLQLSLTLSTAFSYVLSVLYNFTLNRFWAFNARERASLKRHMLTYLVLVTFNFFFTIVAINDLSHHMGYTAAKVVAALVAIPWTYIIYKNYIFVIKKHDKQAGLEPHVAAESIK